MKGKVLGGLLREDRASRGSRGSTSIRTRKSNCGRGSRIRGVCLVGELRRGRNSGGRNIARDGKHVK